MNGIEKFDLWRKNAGPSLVTLIVSVSANSGLPVTGSDAVGDGCRTSKGNLRLPKCLKIKKIYEFLSKMWDPVFGMLTCVLRV